MIRIQMAVLAIVVGVAFLTAVYKAEHGFWRGLQKSVAAVGGAPSLAEYTFYHAGLITGAALVPILFLSLAISAIKAHRFWGAVIWSFIATGLGGGFSTLFAIIVVILLGVSSREYWSSPSSSLVRQTT